MRATHSILPQPVFGRHSLVARLQAVLYLCFLQSVKGLAAGMALREQQALFFAVGQFDVVDPRGTFVSFFLLFQLLDFDLSLLKSMS
jgi:hypothetical protein